LRSFADRVAIVTIGQNGFFDPSVRRRRYQGIRCFGIAKRGEAIVFVRINCFDLAGSAALAGQNVGWTVAPSTRSSVKWLPGGPEMRAAKPPAANNLIIMEEMFTACIRSRGSSLFIRSFPAITDV